MATAPWAQIVDDTAELIEAITPTVDATQGWRRIPDGRGEEGGRDRQFIARRWSPVGGVEVFGGGEDQIGRVLMVVASYTDSQDFVDRSASDERDLVAALDPQGTYPSGSGWSLMVRRVLRDEIDVGEPDGGVIRVTYPVRLIWRETAAHL